MLTNIQKALMNKIFKKTIQISEKMSVRDIIPFK